MMYNGTKAAERSAWASTRFRAIHPLGDHQMDDHEKTKEQLIEELAELRRQVAQLQECQQQAALLRAVPLGIHECDSEGRITFVNPAQEGITGCSAAELVGNPQGQVTGFVSVVSDVTEQRKVDTALLESQRRLSTLVSNLPGMAYRCRNDPQWTMDFISDGCVLLTGYTPLAFVGNHEVAYGDIIHPDDREQVWEQVQRAIAAGSHFQLEYRIHTATGEEKWVWEQGIAICSEHGMVEALEGLMMDITEWKRAEEALRTSEERHRSLAESLQRSEDKFRSLVETTSDWVWAVDRDGSYTYASPRVRDLLGYAPEEVLGKTPFDLMPPEEAKRLSRWFSEVAQSRKAFSGLENTNVHKDGRFVTIETSGVPVFDGEGNLLGYQGIDRDITERKRAEEALQKAHDELEEKVQLRTFELANANEQLAIFRRFAEAAGQGFAMADLDHHITYANPAILTLMGFQSLDQFVDRSLFSLHSEHAQKRIGEVVIPTIIRDGYWTGEMSIHSRAGQERDILANAFLVRNENGDPSHYAVVLTDITERKHAEEALRRGHHTLRHLLQSSDHERQTISYEIHDGLAQQLAGAIMQFQTFDHQKHKNPTLAAKAYDAGRTMLQQGHSETRRLIANVRHPILDESGVVEAISHLVHEQNREKGPKIENVSRVDFDRLVPTVENAIYRICQEALTNACQHSGSKKVRVSLLQRKDRVRIEVRDWGVGFDPKTVRENRFGLEGIRQRARLLGGKCSVRSKVGKGTRILVDLPVVERGEE